MSLEKIPGQTRAKRFLRQLLRTENIPHALLFSGMAGIGKTLVAHEFAKLLNCLSPEDFDCCDRCASCRKFDDGHHPDIVWVKPDGAFIKIDQVRDLRERLRFRPFEGKWRVILIQDAQKLREEAANALLKLLEEPPKHNMFVLTVLEPQMLLPTIVSRCCHLRFQPLEDTLIEQHLIREYDMAAPRARELARLAEGSIERIRWLVEDDRISHWTEVLENIEKLHHLPLVDLFSFAEKWAKSGGDLEQDLECIKLWVRDLIFSLLMAEYRPSFEFSPQIKKIVQTASVELFFNLYDQIEQATQHLRLNANKQLTMEGVCLAIRKACNAQGSWNPLSSGRQSI